MSAVVPEVKLNVLALLLAKSIVAPLNSAVAALVGEKTTRGAAEKAVAKVTVSTEDVMAGSVPVVSVISPAVSVPEMLIVGPVPAPASATIDGALPKPL